MKVLPFTICIFLFERIIKAMKFESLILPSIVGLGWDASFKMIIIALIITHAIEFIIRINAIREMYTMNQLSL